VILRATGYGLRAAEETEDAEFFSTEFTEIAEAAVLFDLCEPCVENPRDLTCPL
jgi:hypothetical protein